MNILELAKKYPELKKILDSVCSVDVGNTFVKTNEGVAVPSTVVEVAEFEDITDASATLVEWNNKKFIVGSRKGNLNMQADKYKTEHYKVSLLNAIALHYEDKTKIETRLCLGLPAKFYTEHAEKLKNEIKTMDKQSIKVDGTNYEIKIIDVAVFKQGGTLSVDRRAEFKYPLMIIDFGGGTLDISYWEEQKAKKRGKPDVLCLTDARSFTEFGFELVMSEFATKCNQMPGSDGKFTVHDVITFIEDNEIPFGDETLLNDLKDQMFRPYCETVVGKINTELKPNSCKDIRIIGGPAAQLKEYLNPLFTKGNLSLIDEDDSQCVNAQLFADRYKEELAVEYLEANKEVAATEE